MPSPQIDILNWPERPLPAPRPWWERAGRLFVAGALPLPSTGGGMDGGLIMKLKGKLGPDVFCPSLPSPWASGPPVVCLTHDLDWAECWRALEAVVEMELVAGVRSTIFVLTRGPYRLSRQMLADLKKEGFEIALHGLWHDLALGMRPRWAIREFLARAMEELGMEVKGFRAPAFSFSPRLILELARAGFAYDSSLAAWWQGVGGSPWRVEGLKMLELPVWGSDHRLLMQRALPPRQAASRLVEAAARGCGLAPAVINIHPGVAMAFKGFFSELLSGLVALEAEVGGAASALGLEE